MARFARIRVEFLPTDSGGRKTPIRLSPGYRPHLRVLGGDGEYLGVEFVDGPDAAVSPGSRVDATVRFMYEPAVCYTALAVGAQIEVMEGPKAVATGQVTHLASDFPT